MKRDGNSKQIPTAKETVRTDFKEGRWGLVFKNGKLYSFGKRYVLVLSGWPDLRAWCKTRSRPWHASRTLADSEFTALRFPAEPHKPVPVKDDDPSADWYRRIEATEKAVSAAYLASFPSEVLDEVCRYSDRRWHLACLFARCPAALSLSRENPPLAYALASNWVFHKPAPSHPMRAARTWIRKDRRLLAEWLGFPCSTAAVHVLGGIVPKSLSIPGLLYLRNALRNPEVVSTLGRLERINADVFALFTAPELRPYLSWRLIREVSMRTESDAPERLLLFHLRAILRRAKESGCLWKIGRFESLAQVEQIGLELLWPY